MSTTPQNMIAILATYRPATDTRGSRIKLNLPRFNKTRFIPYDHTHDGVNRIALAWLAENGIPVTHEADGVEHGNIFLVPFTSVDAVKKAFKL